MGAGAGLGLHVLGKLLGHRNVETTNRYAHLDAHPLRIAANRVASEVADAMGEARDKGEVVPLRDPQADQRSYRS